MKILPLTFWQIAIVLSHFFGRIPLGNVGGIIILSQKNVNSNLLLLIF